MNLANRQTPLSDDHMTFRLKETSYFFIFYLLNFGHFSLPNNHLYYSLLSDMTINYSRQ